MSVLKELYTVQYLTSVFDFYVDPKEKIETMIGKKYGLSINFTDKNWPRKLPNDHLADLKSAMNQTKQKLATPKSFQNILLQMQLELQQCNDIAGSYHKLHSL